MTAINFPDSPTLNDVFTSGSRSWKWDGSAWRSVGTEFGPTGPTGPTGPAPDTSTYASKTYADNAAAAAAAAIVDSAPGTLDTLNELAAALGDDANYASTISTALGNKQDKVSGVSDTEIGYLDGVTSAIQTQLDGKAATSHTQNASTITTTSTDKSANYTLQSADKNSFIRSTGNAITITVPDVLADGESVQFIQAGSGQITFAGSGVTLNSADSLLKTAKQYAGATVLKSGGAYYLIGNLG